MFLCHWHKHQVKGHGGDEGGARAPGNTWAVARGYLHKEFLMVLHHAVMVLVCFPLSVVSWGAENRAPVPLMPASQEPGMPRVLVPAAGQTQDGGSPWRVYLDTRPAPDNKGAWLSLAYLQHGALELPLHVSLSFVISNIRHTVFPMALLEGHSKVMLQLCSWTCVFRLPE